MVLNVIDEIINGQPKYNITPNGDGTNLIELANEVVQNGTPLNRNLFNEIENVLSYQVPNVTKIGGGEVTYDKNFLPLVNSTTPTWSGVGVIGYTITQTLEDFNGISPIVTYKSKNDLQFYANNSSSSSYEMISTTYNNITYKTSEYFERITRRTAKDTIYYNKIQEHGWLMYYDFIVPCKVSFKNGHNAAITIHASNDNTTWTQLESIGSDANSTLPSVNYRYYKIVSSGLLMYYFYPRKIVVFDGTNEFTISTITSLSNSQRILLYIPSNVESDVFSNTLNNIEIDTILQPSKYYELVYNESQNKFIAQEVRN